VNTTNESPTAPAILAPANNAVVASLGADIALANSTDPDSAVISYYIELDTVLTFDSTGSATFEGVDFIRVIHY